MRALALLLVCGFLATPLTAAGTLDAAVEAHGGLRRGAAPHPSIHVVGDAGFLDPASGVVGGSGTAADPYRIAGWSILHARSFGIRLEGTRAHVVIEDVAIPRQHSLAAANVDCTVRGYCAGGSVAIHLDDAQNVVVRRVSIQHQAYALVVSGSSRVLVQDARIGDDLQYPLTIYRGVEVVGSDNVTLERLSIRGTHRPFLFDASQDVTLRASEAVGLALDHEAALTGGMVRLRLEGNRLENVTIEGQGDHRDASFVHNRFLGPRSALYFGADSPMRRFELCGNEFRGGQDEAGLFVSGGDNGTLRGNVFDGNVRGVFAGPVRTLLMERNLFANHSEEGLWISGFNATYRENAFVGNTVGAYLPLNNTDVTDNWWGSASGPSGIGPGTGDALATAPGRTVHHAPWLTQMPDLAVDCGPAATGPVAPAPAPAPLAQATLEVVVRVGSTEVRLGPTALP